jgi:hemoglobin
MKRLSTTRLICHNADETAFTLLDAIGGPPAVRRIVEALVGRLVADPLLAPALGRINLAQLQDAQTSFFVEAFGGVPVSGRHGEATVLVSGDQLIRVALHLHQALAMLDFPDPLREELMAAALAHAFGAPPA